MAIRLLTSALFAGIAAGLIAVLLQFWLVTPLLLDGEAYETGAKVHFAGVDASGAAGHDHSSHDHGHATTGDDAGQAGNFGRHAMTLAVNMILFTGFGLILVAGFALAANFGKTVSAKTGMVWGLAGFIAIQLAPAAGLFPELPGTPSTDVYARQWWWLATAVATVAGIVMIAYGNSLAYIVLGILIAAFPHAIGAPQLSEYAGVAPPELAALFVTRTLFVAMVAWVSLGAVAGHFWSRSAE